MESQCNSLGQWYGLIQFQLNIAERWLERGRKIHNRFSKFFFFFAGFNAIYFLWFRICGLKNKEGNPAGEGKQIENLLNKLEDEASEILKNLSSDVKYFCERRPIARMDRRTSDKPREKDFEEGEKAQELLKKSSANEKLIGLGNILYLVRSNLVHGSKADSGDDEDIIKHSINPLEIILDRVISMTKRERDKKRGW